MFRDSSSWCRGLVCSILLWHFPGHTHLPLKCLVYFVSHVSPPLLDGTRLRDCDNGNTVWICLICNSPPVRGDNPRALASGLCYVQMDKHDITSLYHLHQCRPCTSRDILC